MHINHSIQCEMRAMREIERIGADVHFRLDERIDGLNIRIDTELFESNAFALTLEIAWLIKENLAALCPLRPLMTLEDKVSK